MQPSPRLPKLPPLRNEKYKESKALPFIASHRNQNGARDLIKDVSRKSLSPSKSKYLSNAEVLS
jgi:hypothetical protein